MIAKTPKKKTTLFPLQTGQLWRVDKANLKVEMVGKLLVHYKLGLPQSVRVPTSIASIVTLQKYMKANKAKLIRRALAA